MWAIIFAISWFIHFILEFPIAFIKILTYPWIKFIIIRTPESFCSFLLAVMMGDKIVLESMFYPFVPKEIEQPLEPVKEIEEEEVEEEPVEEVEMELPP